MIPARRWSAKPPLGARLNRSHQLSTRISDFLLFNEGAGLPVNLASPTIVTTKTGSPTWEITRLGLAGACTGGASYNIPDHGNIAAGDFTVRVVHRPASWNAGSFVCLLDKGSGGRREVAVFIGATGDLVGVEIGASAFTSVARSLGMTANGVWDFVLTRTATACQCYVNGVAIGATFTEANANASANPMAFGSNPSGGGNTYDGSYILGQTWIGRALTQGEVVDAYVNLWSALEQPARMYLNSVAAASGTTYPQLERGIRGLNRGVALGSFH